MLKHRSTGSLTIADRPPTAGQRHIQCFESFEYYVRVRIRFYIRLKMVGWLLLPLLVGCAGLMAPVSRAQMTLNVTNFGAVGDAVQFFVNTTSNSVVVTSSTIVQTNAIGDMLEVFGAGTPTYGMCWVDNNRLLKVEALNSNQTYFVGIITSIVNGTNIYLSSQMTNIVSPVVVTSALSSTNISQGIQCEVGYDVWIWVGAPTNSNQDLTAIITNIVDGTNLYVNLPPLNTLTNAFATYGHDNRTNFQNALNSISGPNNVINIPAGTYLFGWHSNRIVTGSGYAFGSIILTNGGFTLNGAGTNATILMAEGAWANYDGYNQRCPLFDVFTPVSNDYPVTLQNFTLDGGVPNGLISYQGWPPDDITGLGWDGSSTAFVVFPNSSKLSANTFSQMTWSNLVFQHWRGEMAKDIEGSTNGRLSILNCTFNDGNASAINYCATMIVSNCVFSNIKQIAEFYQQWQKVGVSYWVSNTFNAQGLVFNGGCGNNPYSIVYDNTFNLPGGVALETTPGDNIIFTNNIINNVSNSASVALLGANGYQGTFDNSNIVIAANVCSNVTTLLELDGGSISDPNRIESVWCYNNLIGNSNSQPNVVGLLNYYWTTNIYYYSNDFSGVSNSFSHTPAGSVSVTSLRSPYVLVPTNNIYWAAIRDMVGQTNFLTYANGSRYQIYYTFLPQTVYALTDSDSNQIPACAQILIQNDNWSSHSIPIYLNSALTRGPVNLDYGQSLTATWSHGIWQTNVPDPPTGFHLVQ